MLDVSEGGISVGGFPLPVGSVLTFVLEGDGIRCTGEGHVVHRTDGATGIAVDRWTGAEGDLGLLVNAQLFADMSWKELYVSDWP